MFFSSYSIFTRDRGYLLSGAAAFFILLLSLTVSYAQKTVEINSGMNGDEQIEGRVFLPAGDTTGVGITVKLRSMSSSEITGMAAPDGSFRFTHLRTDTYTIIVDAGDAYEKATEIVSVGFAGSVPAQGNLPSYVIPLVYPVQIYLKPKHPNSAAASNPAFADVPPAARDLFQQALENARAGNHVKAIVQLKAAISLAPKFARAYEEMAAEYLKTGQGDQAVQTLKEAVETNPDDLTLRLNYGIALLNRKKFETAETELRLVYQKNNADSPTAGYYLGLALMSQQKIDEAQSVFKSVIRNGGDKLALAHRYLGGIYWRNKQYREAADELEKYLKLEPKAADAEKIRSTIKELRHKT
jgi:Tfp pilus assembly protein PilF